VIDTQPIATDQQIAVPTRVLWIRRHAPTATFPDGTRQHRLVIDDEPAIAIDFYPANPVNHHPEA
jgi:hypothetical protein